MKNRFILILFLFLVQVCFAQQPNYISPSPQVATFLQYRDYPVDLSTGLVDISIPLMNLKLKSYEFPISAQFHASGHKVDMSYSELGSSWKLGAYGMISREVRGQSDEYFNFDTQLETFKQNYYELDISETDIGTREDKWRRRSSLDGSNGTVQLDSERDIYTISFNGMSSSFIFINSEEAVFLDYFPYKIRKGTNNSFVLRDDKGIEFTFGNVVENGTTYGAVINSNSQQVGSLYWYIGKVSTPEKEFLRFKYNIISSDGFYLGGNALYGATATLGDYAIKYGSNSVDYSSKYSGVLRFNIQNNYYNDEQKIACLTDVESSIGKISFAYNTGRYSLNEMILTNGFNQQVRKISFTYQSIAASNLSIPNNKGLTLKEVRILSPDNVGQPQIYNLEYYPEIINALGVSEYSYGRDYWGYANSNRNYNIIPVDQVVQTVGVNGSNSGGGPVGNNNLRVGNSSFRNPNYWTKLIGMIKKITYPTGGYAEFLYEANRYRPSLASTSTEEGPGLRISEIKQSDGVSAIIKKYKYGTNEDGVGTLSRKPTASDFQTTQFVTDIPEVNGVLTNAAGYVLDNAFRYRYREFYSDPVGYIRPAYSIPIYYSSVTEYQSDEIGNNLGKTNYTFQTPIFELNSKEFNDNASGDNFIMMKFVPHYYSRSRLANVSVYEFSNNVFNPKKSTTYTYSKKKEIKLPHAAYFRRHRVLSERSYGGTNYEEQFVETKYPNSTYTHPNILFPWGVIGTRYYELTGASITLDNVSETDYTATGQVIKSTSNYYESVYTNSPSMIKISDSRGGYAMTKIYYPDDISTSSSLIGGDMSAIELQGVETMKKSSGHFASVPIQIENYYNADIPKKIERFSFKLIAGNPLLFKKQSGTGGSLLTDYEIMQYDSYSNPVELKAKENMITSYIWGNNGQYPIAEAKNAAYSDIAFTGFEDGDSGNWTWTGQVITENGNSYDGEKFLGLSPGQWISKTGLNSLKKYRVSLWLWGNITPPAGYISVAKKGEWTNFVKIVSGITTFTFTYAESVNGMVDNISICPVDAMMSTYTYKPLVGMTSRTDARGVTEYYQYDGQQRLKAVLDQFKDIVKAIDYNYRSN